MNITSRLRARRAAARNRRAIGRAIDEAATPAMRHELLVIAQQRLPHMR
jgi:hypothetical protein